MIAADNPVRFIDALIEKLEMEKMDIKIPSNKEGRHSKLHSSKAIVAIARILIRIIYKVIKGIKTYTEYGGDYFIKQLSERLQRKTQTA